MKLNLAAAIMLLSVGSATAADLYDAVYVSDPAVCAKAGDPDMGKVLFDLHATAVAPRVGFWVGGEMTCTMVDASEHPSPIADKPTDVEIYATARCYAADLDFRDSVIVTAVSQGINGSNGDTGLVPEDKVEVMSMRADVGGETMREQDGYAGIYTRCADLKAEDFAWKP